MNDSYALLSDNVIYRKDEISCSCIYLCHMQKGEYTDGIYIEAFDKMDVHRPF